MSRLKPFELFAAVQGCAYCDNRRQLIGLESCSQRHSSRKTRYSDQIVSLNAAGIGLRALPIALLGGMESVRGALLAGAIIGVGEALASVYVDPFTKGVSSQILPYVIMIGVLLFRPQGLFGWEVIERL